MHGHAARPVPMSAVEMEMKLNRIKMTWLIAAMLLVIVTAGCDQLSTDNKSAVSATVVVDLEAIAKVTGQNAVIEEQMEATRNEVNATINTLIADLEKRLEEAQLELGDSPGAEAQMGFQELRARAQQQLAQQRSVGQQMIQEYQAGLVADFRNTVKPIAAEIAKARGSNIILVFDPMMLWFDPTSDITDEVIGVLRDRSIEFPSAEAPEVAAAPAAPAPAAPAAPAAPEAAPAAE
jgi:Skp family chaperone for outer membrane proteins